MIYLINYENDEYLLVEAVLEAPEGMDLASLEQAYLREAKPEIRGWPDSADTSPFVEWLVQRHSFKRVECHDHVFAGKLKWERAA